VAEQTPNPGSIAAIRAGCICDTWDNNENIGLVPGKGLVFTVHEMCPLHGIGTSYYAEEEGPFDPCKPRDEWHLKGYKGND
jgi:hypothetical protein